MSRLDVSYKHGVVYLHLPRGRENDGSVWFKTVVVPVRPDPVPFAADVVLFTAFWWLLLFGPFALRRTLRRRAGKCVKCKYDLTGIDADQPCPECGRVDEKRARLGSSAQEAAAPTPTPAA